MDALTFAQNFVKKYELEQRDKIKTELSPRPQLQPSKNSGYFGKESEGDDAILESYMLANQDSNRTSLIDTQNVSHTFGGIKQGDQRQHNFYGS